MIRLIFAELRAGWATWIGVVFVSAVTALASGIAISMVETGLHTGEEYLQDFSGGTGGILMFSAPAGITVTATITKLAVDLGRPAYARWQLAGVIPFQTATVVIIQIMVAGLLGGVIGFAATTVIAEPAIQMAFAGGTGRYSEIPIITGPITASITISATVIITFLGGLCAARAAGSTPPLAALREPDPEAKRVRWWRWILLLAVVAGAIAFFVPLFHAADHRALLNQSPLIPVVITVVLATAGPLLYPGLLRGWTALVPTRVSTSWYLARHQARYHLSRSTASITPLFTGAALLGGLFTMSATVDTSLRAGGEDGVNLEISQVFLMLGGPVLLAAVGAAVVIFMSNRTQGTEQALLRASGATTSTVVASALWQAFIHVITAAILGGVTIIMTAIITASALGRFMPAEPTIDALYALALVGVGLVITSLATVLPVATRARESVALQLAAG